MPGRVVPKADLDAPPQHRVKNTSSFQSPKQGGIKEHRKKLTDEPAHLWGRSRDGR
jgi:hypothetical protein